MKAILAVLMLGLVMACGPRRVEVQTGEQQAAEVALHVTNRDNQTVRVFVVHNNQEIFAGEVAAGEEKHLPVSGVKAGTQVTLRARRLDGTRTYTSDPMSASGMTAWRVP